MQNALIEQGLSLMLYGMGVVFIFLTLLIFATTAMSRIVQRWFPQAIEPAKPVRRNMAGATTTVSPLTIKIIQAAIEQHRAR